MHRASIPVVAAVGSVFIEKKTPTRREFVSLLIIVSGVGIAVWEGSASEASVVGIILCILGELAAVPAVHTDPYCAVPPIVLLTNLWREAFQRVGTIPNCAPLVMHSCAAD